MTTAVLPPPVDLGLPDRFDRWRHRQDVVVRGMADAFDDYRFVVGALPVGAGKSLDVMSLARLRGGRTVVLTSTKALAEQYMRDFASTGLVEVKGQNAYPCRALIEPDAGHLEGGGLWTKRKGPAPDRTGCDDGPCHLGLTCRLRLAGCRYYDAVRIADDAELLVTNYAWWLAINAFRRRQDPDTGRWIEGIGPVHRLVLDECHDAPSHLSDFLTTTLTQQDAEVLLHTPLLPADTPADTWRAWAASHLTRMGDALKEAKTQVRASGDPGLQRRVRMLRSLVKKLALLGTSGVEWAVEPVAVEGVVPPKPDLSFAPIDPAPLAESHLFRGTPEVLLVSATVRPKTLDYLGIPRDQATFFEEPSTFPVARRPVYHIPTVRVDFRLEQRPLDERQWLDAIDRVIRLRPGVRGIIHTGSYARMRMIYGRSKFQDRMLTHRSSAGREGDTLAHALAVFRGETGRPVGEGLWLLSPALTTGYDFSGDQCRVQIITKVPFSDTRSLLLQARQARDPDYGMYVTAQTLVQAVGRSTRSETDWSEVVILDNQVSWFVRKYRHFLPGWFLEAYRQVDYLPPAPTWEAA